MRSYKVIVSNDAVNDLDAIADYIAHRYKSTSGHNFVNRILGQLESLSYSAETFQTSRFFVARQIHSLAKTMNIIHHRWTVIFHIEGNFVIVDRIIHSSRMSQ